MHKFYRIRNSGCFLVVSFIEGEEYRSLAVQDDYGNLVIIC